MKVIAEQHPSGYWHIVKEDIEWCCKEFEKRFYGTDSMDFQFTIGDIDEEYNTNKVKPTKIIMLDKVCHEDGYDYNSIEIFFCPFCGYDVRLKIKGEEDSK